MARLRRLPLIVGGVVGVVVLAVVGGPGGTTPSDRAAPPVRPEERAARAGVIAYFAATASLWNWQVDASKPSPAQTALVHTAGTDQAIAATNRFIAGAKATMMVTKTTVTTEIVRTSVVGPREVTTISDVTTDWTLRDQGNGEDSDASATVGHKTTTMDTPAGAAVISDTVLPDS